MEENVSTLTQPVPIRTLRNNLQALLLVADRAYLGIHDDGLWVVPMENEKVDLVWDIARHLYRSTRIDYTKGLHRDGDMELKSMAQSFGALLRPIIETVDRRGLKRRYLQKHKPFAVRFLKSVASSEFSSRLAKRYKERFQKSGKKMFTFLDHDGVPWNNNNAEHAIKRFAKYRRDADGRFTERTLGEYLVLSTVFETCEFNNVNVLKFLLSKETTLEGST
jgi:hypothetical protein